MKYQVIGMLALGLLAGCATPNTPTTEQYEKIAEQLGRINQQLEAINKSLESNSRLAKLSTATNRMYPATLQNRGDLVALSKIPTLSDNATTQEITKYIGAIKQASVGQNSYSPSDVQVEMLKAIGPGHLEVIMPFLSNDNFHMNYALPFLVDDKDKDIVLKNILRYPKLASVAIKRGWGKEAKEDIFKVLEAGSGGSWELMRNAALFIETPEDRERIIKIYINGSNTNELFNTIKAFPGIDLAKINNEAWKKHQYDQQWSRLQYATRAADTGNLEALAAMIQILGVDRSSFNHNDSAITLIRLTGQSLDYDKLMKWFEVNKDNLYFDKEQRCFLVRKKAEKPASPPAPAQP